MALMTIDQMRWALNKAYPGNDWMADVACMSDKQVAATYQRLLDKKLITTNKEKTQ